MTIFEIIFCLQFITELALESWLWCKTKCSGRNISITIDIKQSLLLLSDKILKMDALSMEPCFHRL